MLTYYFKTIINFFIIGAILLSLFTIWVYRSGAVHRSRHADGTMNPQSAWQGKALSLVFLAMVLVLLVIFDFTLNQVLQLTFWQISVTNFTLMFLLTLFDSFFVDLFVLARWKPAFLKVPEEVSVESMRFHVKKTFQLGFIINLFIAIISTILYTIGYFTGI